MAKTELDRRVGEVRAFNRFWTRRIGVLREGYLESPFSLAEVRVLYELAHRGETTAKELGTELGLDAGYLSRILRGFGEGGLLRRRASEVDGRRSILWLTHSGRAAVASLEERSRRDIGTMLGGMSGGEQDRLVGAMRDIEGLFEVGSEAGAPYKLRTHGPGDMGWVVHRHGVLYAREYGWDERFEALVARIVADFIEGYDPERERCWIAERGGEVVGSVFVVQESAAVAKLRLLLVEPSARGLGLGNRLVERCVGFARDRGYDKLTLWTNSVLHAARRIYEEQGFELVEQAEHRSFGKDLIGQNWELDLTTG